MKIVQFVGNHDVRLDEISKPKISPDEVLVKVQMSAICGSEMHTLAVGLDPKANKHNSGHELVGVVAEVPEGCDIPIGKRVGINIMLGCGKCVYCLTGDPVHCPELYIYQDGHSEYIAIDRSCLVPIPDGLSWEAAALMCGDTLGTPYHAIKRMGGVHAGQRAAVFGFGPIGIGTLVWLKYYGLYTIVSEISPYRRELAKKLGADLVLNPKDGNVVEQIREMTHGGTDICFDCAGVEATTNDALDVARVYGRVGFIGEKSSANTKLSSNIIRKELTIFGSWYFTNAEFYEQVDCLERGLSIDGIITHQFELSQAEEAYKTFREGNTGKVVFRYPKLGE